MADRFVVPFVVPAIVANNPASPSPNVPSLGSYEQFQGDLAPAWLQQTRGRAWNEASGKTKDQLVDTTTDAVQARFVQSAPIDALPQIAADRLLERYPLETTPIFRSRIAGAWEVWEFAGTLYGLQVVLEQAGWLANVVEHWRTDSSIWAEFSVFLQPKTPITSPVWDTANWDAFFWDYDTNALPLEAVLRLIAKFKAGHSKLRELWLVDTDTVYWDEFNWDAANWQSSSSYRYYP